MSCSANLSLITSVFPGVTVLTVEQFAQLLGRSGRSGYEQTRRELDRGTLLPGLRKHGSRWQIPVAAVAEWLDGLVVKPDVAAQPPRHRRRAAASDVDRLVAHATTQRRGGRRRSGNGLARSEYVMTLDVSHLVDGRLVGASDQEEIRAFWSDVLALLPACSGENA